MAEECRNFELLKLLREAARFHQDALVALYDLQLRLAVALAEFAPTLAPRPVATSESTDRDSREESDNGGSAAAEPASGPAVDAVRYLKTVWGQEQLSIVLSVIRDFKTVSSADPVRMSRRSRLDQLEHYLCIITDDPHGVTGR